MAGHSPLPRGREHQGAQNTSIDAFLVAETTTGRRRAYLLEWKHVEQYQSTRPDFKGEGRSGDTRRLRYAEPFRALSSSFNPEAAPELDDFLYEPFYQIMRQRLLADRMVQQRELDVDEAKVVVVVPEGNRAYRAVGSVRTTTSPPLAGRFPQLETVEAVVRASLRDPTLSLPWWPHRCFSTAWCDAFRMKPRNGPTTGGTAMECDGRSYIREPVPPSALE